MDIAGKQSRRPAMININISYYFPFCRIKVVRQEISGETQAVRINFVPVPICGGSESESTCEGFWSCELKSIWKYGARTYIYPIHTGKLEEVHDKIKVIKRKAYGYHG